MRVSWFCTSSALSRLALRTLAKVVVKLENSLASFCDLSCRAGSVVPFDGLVDGVLQAGLGVQRRLAVVLLAGDDEIADGRAVGDQLAVDIAGQIGLGDAAAVGLDPGRDPLEAEIGESPCCRRRSPAPRQSRG